MRILMLSTDRRIFEDGSAVRARMVSYGRAVRELHIVVFSLCGFQREQIGPNVWAYPTNSKNKLKYIYDGIRLGKQIIKGNHSVETDKWLVTSQDPFETGLSGWRVARAFKLPIELQIHTDIGSRYFLDTFLNKTRLLIARFLLPRAQSIRVVSPRIKKVLINKYGIPITKIFTLPVFVDIEHILNAKKFDVARSRYPNFKKIILMVARLEKEKDISTAIIALRDVFNTNPEVGLVIVGDGSERDTLGGLVSKIGVEDNVVFEKWADDTASFYKSADIFLLTSLYEGYGMTLIEAAASGCPIVTTDVGSVGSIINKNNALVCKVKDTSCIARQVRFALENRGVRERLAENASAAISVLPRTEEEYINTWKKHWEDAVRFS